MIKSVQMVPLFFKLKAVWGKVTSKSSKAISKNGNENDPVKGFKP